MPNFLDEILKLKRRRVEQSKANVNFDELKAQARKTRAQAKFFALRATLGSTDKINVIAEIKRASPSKGVINDKIDAAEVARSYEKGGACAISVLTEEDRFQGSLEDLQSARRGVDIPILRKDFIFDEFQVYEAAASGADSVLLIAAALDDERLLSLCRLAEDELKIDALVEVHTIEEMHRAKAIGARVIGVNNRDLHSFKISLDVSRELIKHAPRDALMIAESGLSTKNEILELRELGFSGFLIGEVLMRSENAEEELRNLTIDLHGYAQIRKAR